MPVVIPDPTISPAKAYLYTQTLAAPLFAPPVAVVYDEPGPYKAADIVAFGTVHWHPAINSGVGSGGAGWIEERYDIELMIQSFLGGDNGKAAYERACALFAGVMAVLRADPSLNGIVLVAKPAPATVTTEHDPGHKGWVSRVDGAIECYQRI